MVILFQLLKSTQLTLILEQLQNMVQKIYQKISKQI